MLALEMVTLLVRVYSNNKDIVPYVWQEIPLEVSEKGYSSRVVRRSSLFVLPQQIICSTTADARGLKQTRMQQ